MGNATAKPRLSTPLAGKDEKTLKVGRFIGYEMTVAQVDACVSNNIFNQFAAKILLYYDTHIAYDGIDAYADHGVRLVKSDYDLLTLSDDLREGCTYNFKRFFLSVNSAPELICAVFGRVPFFTEFVLTYSSENQPEKRHLKLYTEEECLAESGTLGGAGVIIVNPGEEEPGKAECGVLDPVTNTWVNKSVENATVVKWEGEIPQKVISKSSMLNEPYQTSNYFEIVCPYAREVAPGLNMVSPAFRLPKTTVPADMYQLLN